MAVIETARQVDSAQAGQAGVGLPLRVDHVTKRYGRAAVLDDVAALTAWAAVPALVGLLAVKRRDVV